MEIEVRPVGKEELQNGLTILFYSESRPLPGARCQVELRIEIPVEVMEEHFRDCPDPRQAYLEFTSTFGKTVAFEQRKVRNFIDQKMGETVIELMKREVMDSSAPYITHPDFERRVVLKRYQDWKQTETWRKAHDEALKQSENEQGSSE